MSGFLSADTASNYGVTNEDMYNNMDQIGTVILDPVTHAFTA